MVLSENGAYHQLWLFSKENDDKPRDLKIPSYPYAYDEQLITSEFGRLKQVDYIDYILHIYQTFKKRAGDCGSAFLFCTDVASRSHLFASDVAARSHLYAYLKTSSS